MKWLKLSSPSTEPRLTTHATLTAQVPTSSADHLILAAVLVAQVNPSSAIAKAAKVPGPILGRQPARSGGRYVNTFQSVTAGITAASVISASAQANPSAGSAPTQRLLFPRASERGSLGRPLADVTGRL